MKFAKKKILFHLCITIVLNLALCSIKLELIQPRKEYLELKKSSFGIPYVDIENGTKLHLRCIANQSMNWNYPLINYENESENEDLEINENCTNKICITDLIINETYYEQTGFYSCLFKSTNEGMKYLKESANIVYIFVNDDLNLILPYEGNPNFIFLSLVQSESSVIPCSPTNSLTKMSLWKMHTITGNPEKLELDNQQIIYDATNGFIFKSFRWTGDLTYLHCKAEYKNRSQEINVNIHLTENQAGGINPIIDDSNARNVLLNTSFTLNCIVKLELGVLINIEWTWPNQFVSNTTQVIKEQSESVRHTLNNHEYDFVNRKLTIINATKLNEGNYTCSVSNAQGKLFKDTKYIQILNASLPADLKFSTDLNQSKPLTIKLGEMLLIVIQIYALPSLNMVKLDWFKNKDFITNIALPIEQSFITTLNSRIECKLDKDQAILIIQNTTVEDSGVYTLVGNNSNVINNISIVVQVNGPPLIQTINLQLFYKLNISYTLSYTVISFPEPSIWFKKYACSQNDCLINNENHWQTINITKQDKNDTYNNNEEFGQVILYETDYNVTYPEIPISTSYHLNLNITPKYSFIYRMFAENVHGTSYKDVSVLVNEWGENGLDVFISNNDSIEMDYFRLTCMGSKFNFSRLEWFWKGNDYKDNNLVNLKKDLNFHITNIETNYSIVSNVQILNLFTNYSSTYYCTGYYNELSIQFQNKQNDTKKLYVDIQPFQEPQIIRTNMDTDLKKIEAFQTTMIDFYCEFIGNPKPQILWKRNGVHLNLTGLNGIELNFNNQHLIIKRLVLEDSGRYECQVFNKLGSIQRYIALKVKNSDELNLPIAGLVGIFTFVIIGFIFVVMAVFMGRKIREDRKQKREFEFLSQSLFEKGQIELFNPDLPFEDQIELLPYNNNLEFPKEKLRLGPTLGQGAFGRVVKGEAEDLDGLNKTTVVAVKMLKETANLEQRKALMAELKILIHLGRHLNIVNLLGAITINISKGELFVIVEYCEFGNLRQFLMTNRDKFIDQINYQTGEINTNINKKQENYYVNKDIIESFKNLDYVNVTSTNSRNGSFHKSKQKNSVWIKTIDLVCYAFQVTRGMDYLASKKLIHRDLAARNVLLAENNIVKICDFGLAKDCYKYDNYIKKGNGLLPIKWMAIESITDKIFTIKSDIWSFGILLWELFTLGSNPYPGLEVDEEFYRKLKNGYRMEKPCYCLNNIYDIMKACWNENPNLRPSFNQLSKDFGQILGKSLNQYYIDLNLPYQKMNQTLYQDNEGYLLINSSRDEEYLDVEHYDEHKLDYNSKSNIGCSLELIPMIKSTDEYIRQNFQRLD